MNNSIAKRCMKKKYSDEDYEKEAWRRTKIRWGDMQSQKGHVGNVSHGRKNNKNVNNNKKGKKKKEWDKVCRKCITWTIVQRCVAWRRCTAMDRMKEKHDRNRKRKRGSKREKRGRERVTERNIVRARGIVKQE
jgi:hypothetical protein